MTMFDDNSGSGSKLALGMFLGAAQAKRRAQENTSIVEDNLQDAEEIIDIHLGESISRGADRDAYKALAEGMLEELKDPSKPRRLSDPDAHIERGRLLTNVHRQSFEQAVERGKANGNMKFHPKAYVQAEQKSLATCQEYLDNAKAQIASSKPRGPGVK